MLAVTMVNQVCKVLEVLLDAHMISFHLDPSREMLPGARLAEEAMGQPITMLP